MPLSERFEEIKFSKSVAGYATKEVDGFIADILPLIKEEEQLLAALRVKLDAFEAQRDDIKKQEQEAYLLLEAAKKEAEIIVATAKKNASDITSEANVASEVQVRAATARAADIISDAESKAQTRISEANAAADKIVATADAKGREMLKKAHSEYDEEKSRASALVNECVAFEARFRSVVADTVQALARMKEETPVPYDAEVKTEAAPVQEPVCVPEPEIKAEEPESKDVEFAGGMPVMQTAKKEEKHQRRLYDTVQVTYDSDDDFADIRDIMRGNEKKSPTHFSE